MLVVELECGLPVLLVHDSVSMFGISGEGRGVTSFKAPKAGEEVFEVGEPPPLPHDMRDASLDKSY